MKQRENSDDPLYNGHVDSVCVCVCVDPAGVDPAVFQKVLCSAVR
jgi:hypothetical protein